MVPYASIRRPYRKRQLLGATSFSRPASFKQKQDVKNPPSRTASFKNGISEMKPFKVICLLRHSSYMIYVLQSEVWRLSEVTGDFNFKSRFTNLHRKKTNSTRRCIHMYICIHQ